MNNLVREVGLLSCYGIFGLPRKFILGWKLIWGAELRVLGFLE